MKYNIVDVLEEALDEGYVYVALITDFSLYCKDGEPYLVTIKSLLRNISYESNSIKNKRVFRFDKRRASAFYLNKPTEVILMFYKNEIGLKEFRLSNFTEVFYRFDNLANFASKNMI